MGYSSVTSHQVAYRQLYSTLSHSLQPLYLDVGDPYSRLVPLSISYFITITGGSGPTSGLAPDPPVISPPPLARRDCCPELATVHRDLSSHEIARLNGVERASVGGKVTPCYNVVFAEAAKVARHHPDTWRTCNR